MSNATREHVIEALAELRVVDSAEVRQTTISSGDIPMKSAEGVIVLARLEKKLGLRLPSLGNLPREQYVSVDALTALIERVI